MKAVIIVIDMLEDFVTGSIGTERAFRIIPNIAKLIEAARRRKVPVVFANDAHLPAGDLETTKIFPPHAVAGSKGAQVIKALEPKEEDHVMEKRRYSSFFGTDLDLYLRERGVDTVILTGMHSDCCVRHTAADAWFRAYNIVVPEDCVEAMSAEDHEYGIKYLERYYKAEITDAEKVIARIAN